MKIYNIVLGAAFMMALALASSCQKSDTLDNPTDQLTKLDESSLYVYNLVGSGYAPLRYNAVYDETRTVIYFDGKYAGKIKRACYDAGIRMSVIMGNYVKTDISSYPYDYYLSYMQLSSDLANFDEEIEFDGIVFACVKTSVENAYKLPGVEYASPFCRLIGPDGLPSNKSLPIQRWIQVRIDNADQASELTKMVNDFGCELYFVPESGIGRYTVICNKNTKGNGYLVGNALLESKKFSYVHYDLDHGGPAYGPSSSENNWDGAGGYGGYLMFCTGPHSIWLQGEESEHEAIFGSLDDVVPDLN